MPRPVLLLATPLIGLAPASMAGKYGFRAGNISVALSGRREINAGRFVVCFGIVGDDGRSKNAACLPTEVLSTSTGHNLYYGAEYLCTPYSSTCTEY